MERWSPASSPHSSMMEARGLVSFASELAPFAQEGVRDVQESGPFAQEPGPFRNSSPSLPQVRTASHQDLGAESRSRGNEPQSRRPNDGIAPRCSTSQRPVRSTPPPRLAIRRRCRTGPRRSLGSCTTSPSCPGRSAERPQVSLGRPSPLAGISRAALATVDIACSTDPHYVADNPGQTGQCPGQGQVCCGSATTTESPPHVSLQCVDSSQCQDNDVTGPDFYLVVCPVSPCPAGVQLKSTM
jgi:hypothetical protein